LAKATFALKWLKKKTRGLLVSGALAGSAFFLSIMVADGEIQLNLSPCPLLYTPFAVVVICF